MSQEKELRIRKIQNGTVIDHIPPGQSLNVLKVLGVDPSTRDVVSVAMNVPSGKMGTKDIVKVEGREIGSEEADIIALIAPQVSVNVVENYEVREKYDVSMPSEIRGVLRCPNSNCITSTREPVETVFEVFPEELRCRYCETVIRVNGESDTDLTQHLK